MSADCGAAMDIKARLEAPGLRSAAAARKFHGRSQPWFPGWKRDNAAGDACSLPLLSEAELLNACCGAWLPGELAIG